MCVCVWGGGCVKRLTMEWQTEKKEFSSEYLSWPLLH